MDISQTPPVIPAQISTPPAQTAGWRQLLSILLSICLILFIADAALSVLDNSFGLFLRFHGFGILRNLSGFFVVLISLLIYVLMAFTPAIPKRLFAPLVLFNPIMA